ncbi:MAG TPA: FAD-dependent oxidoreductase [Methyloceanibacter sp.]|nr:FAD-dependent oxidoreductase [Methyloceanibacter sp.]
MSETRNIAIRGAGVVGLWQALTLARRGHKVTLCERSPVPFAHACSLYAGAMLAPNCEKETAELIVRDLGRRGLALWRATYPGAIANGTLVVVLKRDRAELDRFARMTEGHQRLSPAELAKAEPALVDRFAGALYYADEGHRSPEPALHFLLEQAQAAGAEVRLGEGEFPADADFVIDCRGLAAISDLPNLRGVRGERIVVKSREVALSRPVRLLHPRFPLYVVPWGKGVYMIGATVIESEETGPITLRSALDLLSATFALDPAFAEAEIVLQGAGARPAFPDNRPRIMVGQRYIYVNGLYRHGFLLAPIMAELVADYIETGATDPEVFVADSC